MPKFTSEKALDYKAEQIEQLVLDIEAYPVFLPWCIATRIVKDYNNELLADMTVSFKGYTETYRSEIAIIRKESETKIEVKAISGPFKYLENIWVIKSQKDNCYVCFMVDFSFKSSILNTLIGKAFADAADRIIVAFEERAKKLFG